MIAKEHKDLPLVPESVLKRRHDLDELRRKKAAQLDATGKLQVQPKGSGKKKLNKYGKQRKGQYVIKPAKLLSMAKSRRNHEIRYKRVKKKGMQKRGSDSKETIVKEIPLGDDSPKKRRRSKHLAKPASEAVTYQTNSVDASMVFVVRIREDQGKAPPKIVTVLHGFRLRKPFQGVFLKYTPATRRLLHMIEPWVLYGTPSEAMIQDLMVRRSFGCIGKERVPLSDNTILEDHLGEEHGIICMEDMIHELVTVGDAFEAASKFLYPFQLTCPRSKFEKEKLGAHQGKDYGDKGEQMDEYIKQML